MLFGLGSNVTPENFNLSTSEGQMDLVHSGFTTSVRAELRDEKLFNALLFDNGNRQLKLDLRPTQRRHSAFPVPFTKVQYGVCSGRSYSGNSSIIFSSNIRFKQSF